VSHVYFVRAADLPAYEPANHSGTSNRRLIGRETVGASNLEVVLGVIQKDHGAGRHSHPSIEQVCYVLEGEGVAEIGDVRQTIGVGDCCFCPADVPHEFKATGETPLRLLVIYSPPYSEDPAKIRRAAPATNP
jgi:mannose-6-phosphate isomerase-like protein (cupin superfamily)